MENVLTNPAPEVIGKDLLQVARNLGPVISPHVEEEEKDRRLSPAVFNALKEAGLLRMFLPESLGGYEADPLTVAKVVEEVARYNTAAGWCLMVANVSHWWCNTLPQKGIDEIYGNDQDTFIAGAFHPPMQAMATDGGFVINGRSPLMSYAHEAQWMFITALVMENGQPKMHDGIPEIIGVCLHAADCEIIDTWYTLGMKATDSNDISAREVFVPAHRTFPLIPGLEPNPHFTGKLYRYSAIGIGVAALIVPVALAVATNAIAELKAMAGKKTPFGSAVSLRERGVVQRKLGMAEALVQSARAFLHQTIATCWNKTNAGELLTLEDKAHLLLASAHTNNSCVQAVDMIYSAAGSSAVYNSGRLAHYFCDAQVIRQHGFANESRYETAAQVYFGLQPDLPVIVF